jgi:hypothetical protein
MIKRFAYIVLLLVFAIRMTGTAAINGDRYHLAFFNTYPNMIPLPDTLTTKKVKPEDDKNKVKEIAKAKRLAKPEKVDEPATAKPKPKRERRPEGMERPPEIPRRNGN